MNLVNAIKDIEDLENSVEALLDKHFDGWNKLPRPEGNKESLMETTLILILAILTSTSRQADENVLSAIQVYFDNYLQGIKYTYDMFDEFKKLLGVQA